MDDIDRSLVIRASLSVTGEVSEITARSKDGSHSGHLGNRIGILESLEGLNHEDQHNIVVDGIAVAARDVSPHCRVEGLAASIAPFSEGRKVSPVSCFNRFLYRID